jgi:hypothetical protein
MLGKPIADPGEDNYDRGERRYSGGHPGDDAREDD